MSLGMTLVASICGMLIGACESSEPVKAKEVKPLVVGRRARSAARDVSGAQTTFAGVDPTLVSGYGLVVGLRGTGGQNIPDRIVADYGAPDGPERHRAWE